MADPQRVRSIFLEAIEHHAPGVWSAFLDRACGEEPDLRQRVEVLLRAHDQANSILDVAAVPPGVTVDQPASEAAGTVIGPYKLLEQIGEGGMGTVWLAQQTEPVKRLVAVKLIKAGMDSRQVIARFEAERQALALMDHPNIARVLDAGTASTGRPYFVMDLVKGVPITRYCDEHHLTPRQRLDLFIPVCQAVQHAHQKGIIHRDLKPSNVLVALYDGKPVPKVIDFGVAKAAGQPLTDKTLVTGLGNIVGTLEYMSPEQAEINQLDIDTRSDIYSLGVLLYELLAGSPPFNRKELEKAGMLEMLRVIREDEPSKPSTKLSTADGLPTLAANRGTEPAKLTRLVRGELDWIVMKALEKDRSRRYETANGFAMDVQRYLVDEPVLACPPSAGYRLRKFARRNKWPVIAVSVILLSLVAGIVGTSAGLVWAVRERDDKARALSAETRAREAEKQARDRALAALRVMTDDIVEDQMARAAHLTDENKEFLRKIIKHFESFADLTADDAESRAIRAEGHARVGLMRYRLGELKEAEAAYADALAIYKQLAINSPARPEFRHELALTHNRLGILLKNTGRPKEAETAYAASLALYEQLGVDFPRRKEFRLALATSHNNRGNLFDDTGRPQEAETAYSNALTIQKQLAADFPKDPEVRRALALNHYNLGYLFSRMGRSKEAARAYADALPIRKQLTVDFPARPEFRRELAACYDELGLLHRSTGRLKEAEAASADALAINKQLAADFPTRPEFRLALAGSHNNLGLVLNRTGRVKEAATAYADSLAIKKQLAADFPNHPDIRSSAAGSFGNLARLCNQRGDFKTAKAYLEEALPHHEAALRSNPRHPSYRQFFQHYLVALVHAEAGLRDQAAAVRAAEKLRDLGWDPPGDAYDAGRALARCILIVDKDDKLDAAKRQADVQFYGDQALAVLRVAIAKGYTNAEQVNQDKGLDTLRKREDFKKLLAELQAK